MQAPDSVFAESPNPILSNVLIRVAMEEGRIQIAPFREDMLGPTAYRLVPHRVRFSRDDGFGNIERDSLLIADERPYLLQPKEHVVTSIRETIDLGPGFVGTFYASSRCVESGLDFTGGRIDSGYSHAIVFGLFNGSDELLALDPSFQIARVAFSWLGSLNVPDYDADEPGSYIEALEEKRDLEPDP